MRLEYVETFVDATVRVLEQALGKGFGRGEVCLVAGPRARGEISVTIPLGGELAGAVTLDLGRETAVRLFNHVTGREGACLPPLGIDYLKELGNMIAGAAASDLNDQGFAVTVAPPLAGPSDAALAGLLQVEACQIPIFSEFGRLAVNVTLTTA
jgi:CheY-specific phosphatase CheX